MNMDPWMPSCPYSTQSAKVDIWIHWKTSILSFSYKAIQLSMNNLTQMLNPLQSNLQHTTQINMQMQRLPSTPLPVSVWFLNRGACRPNNNTTLLGTYHTDNCFIYMLKYIILSINVLITSSPQIFLSFQDGDALHNSYIEFITKMFLYFIFWYILQTIHFKT